MYVDIIINGLAQTNDGHLFESNIKDDGQYIWYLAVVYN